MPIHQVNPLRDADHSARRNKEDEEFLLSQEELIQMPSFPLYCVVPVLSVYQVEALPILVRAGHLDTSNPKNR